MEPFLDVSMLEPCEPMERVLEAISQLEKGDFLKVLHRREPRLLYPLLEKLGYAWYCEQQAEVRFIILIWREYDVFARTAALANSDKPST